MDDRVLFKTTASFETVTAVDGFKRCECNVVTVGKDRGGAVGERHRFIFGGENEFEAVGDVVMHVGEIGGVGGALANTDVRGGSKGVGEIYGLLRLCLNEGLHRHLIRGECWNRGSDTGI